MKALKLFLIINLFVIEISSAQLLKIAKYIVNPIGTATEEAVKSVTGSSTIQKVVNPTGLVVDAAIPAVNQWKVFTENAIKTGNWKDLGNALNPWFIQTVTAVNIMRQNHIINDQFECEKIGNEIARGIAIESGYETGDPEVAAVIEKWTQEFSEATCFTAFYRYPDNSYGVTEYKTGDGSNLKGVPVDREIIKTHPARIALFISHFRPDLKSFIYTDGQVWGYPPDGRSELVYQGEVKRDPTGNYFLIYTPRDHHNVYGVRWNGDLIGIKEDHYGVVGQIIILGN